MTAYTIYFQRSCLVRLNSAVAFTLIELLVVLAIIFILAAMLVPTGHHGEPSQGIQCLRNNRQLLLAWIMYADDNQGKLAGNARYDHGSTVPRGNWVSGVMDWSNDSQNTNTSLLLAGGLGVYIKAALLYHCPADQSVSAAGRRVRSYSVNAFLSGNGDRPASDRTGYMKLAKIGSPATTFVFVDEHANSIDDGCFLTEPDQTNRWIDIPAGTHNRAASFGFADGHAEMHRWSEESTLQPIMPGGARPSVVIEANHNADLLWVLERTAPWEAGEPNSQ